MLGEMAGLFRPLVAGFISPDDTGRSEAGRERYWAAVADGVDEQGNASMVVELTESKTVTSAPETTLAAGRQDRVSRVRREVAEWRRRR